MPSSDDFGGKTVSTADTTGDSAPSESDMGVRDAQFVEGDGPTATGEDIQNTPQPLTSGGGGADEGPTAGSRDGKD